MGLRYISYAPYQTQWMLHVNYLPVQLKFRGLLEDFASTCGKFCLHFTGPVFIVYIKGLTQLYDGVFPSKPLKFLSSTPEEKWTRLRSEGILNFGFDVKKIN